jgi:hypothetical protein
MRAVLLALVFAAAASAMQATVPPSPSDPTFAAARRLEAAFSNITFLTVSPGLGSLFTPNGTWCSQKGAPCVTTPANITGYAAGFRKGFGLVDALAHFSYYSSTANYGSFDYTKTFTCTSPCGMRTCLIIGKSGFHIDPVTNLVQQLDDYVDAALAEQTCFGRCSKC